MVKFREAFQEMRDLNKRCGEQYKELHKLYKRELYIIAAAAVFAMFFIGKFLIGKITIEDDEEATDEEENA